MQHTGIYLGDGRVVDARGTNSGVMLSQLEKYAWTHWAAPKGLHAAQPKEEVNIVTIGTAVIMNGNLALRAEPSTGARLIRYMMDKETIEVLHRANNEWFKVRHKGTEGYAMAKFLNFTPSATPEPVPAPVPPKQDGKYTVKIVCNTQAEADTLLRLLKGAVIE